MAAANASIYQPRPPRICRTSTPPFSLHHLLRSRRKQHLQRATSMTSRGRHRSLREPERANQNAIAAPLLATINVAEPPLQQKCRSAPHHCTCSSSAYHHREPSPQRIRQRDLRSCHNHLHLHSSEHHHAGNETQPLQHEFRRFHYSSVAGGEEEEACRHCRHEGGRRV